MNLNPNGNQLTVRTALATQPLSEYEIAAATGLPLHSVHPALTALHHFGVIEPSGLRRKNPTGRSAIVWRLATTPPQPCNHATL